MREHKAILLLINYQVQMVLLSACLCRWAFLVDL